MKTLIAAIALCLPAALAAQTALPPANTSACTAPDGWDDVLAKNPRFVVFGEGHGTNESPDFVARLVCAEAARGQRVLLAIEHAADQNTALQEAWAGPREGLLAALPELGWRGRNDGVASEAMLRLVLAAHALKQGGAAIDIVAFNGARDEAQYRRFADLPAQGPHEAAQAENIAEAAALAPYDRVIVLVGNVHAQITPYSPSADGDAFEPMTMRLAAYGPVISLNMQDAGGTSWSCRLAPDAKRVPGQPITNDMIRCAAYEDKATATHDRPPFVDIGRLGAEAAAGRFHGVFWVGPIIASPPAFPAGQ
jgi:hypothetical protein